MIGTVRAFALLIALGLAGGGVASSAPASGDPFNIPTILPVTGPVAFLGQSIISTLRLVEAKVNREGGIRGRPVHFDVKDDQGSPQIAVQVTEQVLAAKPSAIIGSTLVALCTAMEPLTRSGPVEFCLSPGVHPAYGAYLFSAGFSSQEQARAIIRNLRSRKLLRVAVISSTDSTGQDGDRELDAALKTPDGAGITLVEQQHFNTADQSVAAQMARVKAGNADALIAWTTGLQFGTVLRAYNDAGLSIPVMSNNGNASVVLLDQLAQYLPKDLSFAGVEFLAGPGKRSDPTFKQISDYVAAIKSANLQNDLFVGLGWDPALMLVEAYRKLGTDATPAQLRDYLLGIHRWAGINGVYDFSPGEGTQRGLTTADVYMLRWSPPNRKWLLVSRRGGEGL